MDRSIAVVIFGLALLILQSTQGAELNSEATLNCNGKDFKCVNSTHYQPCSLTERSGQSPQYTINGVVLPCLAGQSCNDENTINCAVARSAQPSEMPSQIPVEVTVVQEPTVPAAEKPSESAPAQAAEKPSEPAPAPAAEKASESAPAKSLPVEDMEMAPKEMDAPKDMDAPKEMEAPKEMAKEQMEKEQMPKEQMATPMPEMIAASNLKGAPVEEPEKKEQSEKPVEKEEKPEKSAEMSTAANATVVDSTKAEPEKTSKKKFSFKGLKKVGPIRLVNGFRTSSLRPKIALDSQKDVADNVREWLYERRNKYEKFVDTVLGKASPVSAKQPVPGQPIVDEQQVAEVPSAPVPPENQRDPSDICEDDDSCDDDYDTCDDGDDSCEDSNEDEDEDDCESSDSCEDDSQSDSCEDSDSESGSCEDDDDDDDDDDDCDEDELEPGEGEAVWEEEEVEGGIEIVEECPDNEEDDCESSDSCESDEDDDYEYEDGISETAEVSNTDSDECDCSSEESSSDSCGCDDSASDDSDDSDEDDCDDSDESEECKKKKKQKQDKKKKKKDGQKKKKKKTGSKKGSSSNKKKADDKEKKAVEKKKVRYPPVQKIRKSLARALQNVTSAVSKPLGRKGGSGGSGGSGSSSSGSGSGKPGPLQGITSGVQNAVLNKVDSLLSIKDTGLFNKGGNSDINTGCSIVEGWSCPRQGRYAHPIDCQKYVQCSKNGVFSKDLSNTVFECEDDEAYDPSIRSCTTDWSSCEALEQCLYNRQLIEDPSDDSSYFICIRNKNKFKESYTVYRRDCTASRVFDPDYQLCVNPDDAKKLAAEKKKRQRIRKQKQCKRKKAQKKKNKGKKKSPKNKKTVRVQKTSQKKH